MNLAELAHAKRLSQQFLRDLGLRDLEDCVTIPYLDELGEKVHDRLRVALSGNGHTKSKKGSKNIPYGLWRSPPGDPDARPPLHLVEGESDCWTLWHHDLCALGVPGANSTGCLQAAHLERWHKIIIVQEPGEGGQQFADGCCNRLRALEYPGNVSLVRMLADPKDPSAIHIAAPRRFKELWAKMLEQSTPVDVKTFAPQAKTPAELRPEPGEDEPAFPLPEDDAWPDFLEEQAFYGLAGEMTKLLAPQTEADPAAILMSILVLAGNAMGRRAYWRVNATKHYPNLFYCQVGDTSLGRKGMSKDDSLYCFDRVDDWYRNRLASGLSSGEGLMFAVRDPVWKVEAKTNAEGQTTETRSLEDEGVSDKRLMVFETEFSRVLKVMRREGNTLAHFVRDAWDHGNLSVMTSKSARKATGAHISILAHCTRADLRKDLCEVDVLNGFANRFIWMVSKRSQWLPLGGEFEALGLQKNDLVSAITLAYSGGEVQFDSEAEALWCDELYQKLNTPPGDLPAGIADRGAPQVRRLALIYTLLDQARQTRIEHLQAAHTLWNYSLRSIRWIFGNSTGDPLADDILGFLRVQGDKGATQTEIGAYLNKREKGSRIGLALSILEKRGLARKVVEKTPGRDRTTWFLAKSE